MSLPEKKIPDLDVGIDRRDLAPRPGTIEQTGLSLPLLEDLISKFLIESGVADLQQLTGISALSGPVVEAVLQLLRADGRIEIKSPAGENKGLRYALTDGGRVYAKDALMRSGYIGPAPVPLDRYKEILLEQSVHKHHITEGVVRDSFSDMVIKPVLLNKLGAAMHSGKAIFIYGPPGTGKTFACQKLARLLGDPVLIPHAVAVGDSIVRVFDPLLHRTKQADTERQPMMLETGFDPRFELCERPFICSGGELTADLLEIQFDASTRQYRAPLQLKSSNGIYLIDDLGRQKMPTAELFNRWIVPMEAKEDYLNMQSGNRMVVPFDLILIFSTNLDPNDLADAAFLRRIGHKIKFDYLDRDEYRSIWQGVCEQRHTQFDPQLVDYVIDELHMKRDVPMLACHPRDLIGIGLDHVNYSKPGHNLDVEAIDIAWDTNFVSFN